MVITVLGNVFKNWRYALLTFFIAAMVLIFSTWLPNLRLVAQISTASSISVLEKMKILGSLVGSIGTNFTVFSASYTIAIAILFGINVSFVAYYMAQQKSVRLQGGAVTGLGGIASGMLGIGCAACGTLILGPLLALIGAGGIIAYLPLGGEEFGILGVGLLSLSVYVMAKKIGQPLVCAIPDTAIKTHENNK